MSPTRPRSAQNRQDAAAASETSAMMGRLNLVSRRGIFAVALVGLSAALSRVGPGLAAGARSGPWCRQLTKAAQNTLFDFNLRLLDGDDDNLFSLSALIGKPVWLQFFASWCGPCNSEAADVVRIATKYGDAIHVVGINVGEEPGRARSFRDTHKIPFPIALDRKSSVFHALGLSEFPTHVFIDSSGYISCISVGDLNPYQMDNEVAVAMARTPQPAASDSATSAPAPILTL